MKSKNKHFEFSKFTLSDIEKRTSQREGEVRIGETIQKESTKKYCILGIEESVGPRANLGNTGAENGFEVFLSKFLNMQANRFLSCEDVEVLGKISFVHTLEGTEHARTLVDELDFFVTDVLGVHLNENQIPIVIGGGHNNCYPILKHLSQQKKEALNVVNLDPHADYRILEGRHSGNGFSYAFKMSYLKKYFVLGLHESYNSEEMLGRLEKDGHLFTFFEDYLTGKSRFSDDFEKYKKEIDQQSYGIGLDLDALVDMPSSAASPTGVTLERARIYMRYFAASKHVSYLHLPEGAPLNAIENKKVGKALAYLVTDFLKVNRLL